MMINAKSAYDQDNFEEALQIYLKIKREEPNNLEALEGVARSYYRLKRFDQALACCSEALDKDGSLAWPHLLQSYVYFLQKKMDICKDEAKIAFEVAPSDWETNFWWGSVLDSENHTDAGLVFLEKAASMKTDNWYLYNNLSVAYSKRKDYKKYLDALENMNRLKPNTVQWIVVHIGRRERVYRIFLFVFHYLLILLALMGKIPILLVVPAFIDLCWMVVGSLNFTQNRRLGVSWISIGILNSLVAIGSYLVLR